MNAYRFEASMALEKIEGTLPAQAVFIIRGQKVSVALRFYEPEIKAKAGRFYIQVSTRRPLSLKWNDPFEVWDHEKRECIGRGVVLNPFLPEKGKFRKEARINLLSALSASEEDMLIGLSREKGTQGLREQEIEEFASLGEERILRLAEKLEKEGKIKIVSFSPLFMISQESFEFLGQKILAFLEQIQQKHPGQRGVALERIKKRFDLSEKILILAVRTLERTGKVREVGPRLSLPSPDISLSPEEDKILQRLEEMCLKGEFQSVSLEEIQREFRLSAERLERLLTLLIERRKIIPGPEGLYIHARWLDDIIGKVRALGKKELTVAEFKAMTGLSRRYAIPLLELLDQMGVTRRQGPVREIL
jgi:selenocysteine-specific elongation factor